MSWDRGFNKWKWVLLFLAPSLSGLLMFIVLPIISSFVIAFKDWNLLRAAGIHRAGQLRGAASGPAASGRHCATRSSSSCSTSRWCLCWGWRWRCS